MNWDVVGVFSETIGALVVFITLVILIVQFRHARTELSSQFTREIKRHNNDAFYQLTQDSALMDLHIR
jgi:hypothetical protein